MLLTTPYIAYETCPRVISEVRKSELGSHRDQSRHRLSGELLVKYGKEHPWWPRKVCIRGGQLLVGSIQGEVKSPSLKIPLRRLSLSAGPLPNSLSLIRGQNVVITLQTTSETSFDTWVKAIAIELIRQTPLEDIKYFDILTIDKCWKNKDQNANCLEKPAVAPCEKCLTKTKVQIQEPMRVDQVDPLENFGRKHRKYLSAIPATARQSAPKPTHEKLRIRSKSCNAVAREQKGESADESSVEVLLKKCQNPESYVPVKEKLLLFETLCRLGRKVRSTEDVSQKHESATKRAKSLHDLSFNSAPVKEICQYFETRNTKHCESKREQRLVHSDSSLHVKVRSSRSALKT